MGMDWAWITRWTGILGRFTIVQLAIQFINAFTGFLIIRLLDKPEYGAFTIANSLISVACISADCGMSHALPAIGGPCWNERDRLSSLIKTALSLRPWLMLNAILVALPISIWVMSKSGLSATQTALFCALSLSVIWPSTSASILCSVTRLHARIGQIQQFDLAGALMRAAWCGAAVFLGLNAVTALMGTLASLLVQWMLVRHQVASILDENAAPATEWRIALKEKLRHLYPLILFYSLQGQVGTWLISITAKTEKVADLGALSRLGVLFAIIVAPVATIATPALSRAPTLARLKTIFAHSLFFFTFLSAALAVVCWFMPGIILWVLGGKYSHLERELFWFSISSGIAGMAAITWGLCTARGWTRFVWLNAAAVLGMQVVAPLWCDISQVMGVIWFSMFANIASLIAGASIAWVEYSRAAKITRSTQLSASESSTP